jgi:hypothetical protein
MTTDIDIEALVIAARDMLEALADLTTEQFSHGEDRPERRALAYALGLDPDEYSL